MSFNVFHSSPFQDLAVLEPKFSLTHQMNWLYATRSPIMSAPFLSGIGGDDTCYIGKNIASGRPFIYERARECFYRRYYRTKGSIYLLPGDSFLEHQTSWSEELISEVPVKPLDEFKVTSVASFLFWLQELDLLDIHLSYA